MQNKKVINKDLLFDAFANDLWDLVDEQCEPMDMGRLVDVVVDKIERTVTMNFEEEK